MAIFQLIKHISIASGLGFAVRKFTKFSVFLALKYTPITGLTDITEFRKKNKKGGGY